MTASTGFLPQLISLKGGTCIKQVSGAVPSACQWIGGIADEALPVDQERIIQKIDGQQRTFSKYGAHYDINAAVVKVSKNI